MASEGQVLQTHRLRRRCGNCLGQGHIVVHYCSECGSEYEDDRSVAEGSEAAVPCAHGAEAYMAVEMVCDACKGTGQILEVVSKAEFDAAKGRRLRRGAVLFMLALIPLVALGWAVLNAEPATVCGSWWYGLLLPAAVVAHRLWR